jgi:hypothetical protein
LGKKEQKQLIEKLRTKRNANSQQPTASNQQPATSNQQPATNNQ